MLNGHPKLGAGLTVVLFREVNVLSLGWAQGRLKHGHDPDSVCHLDQTRFQTQILQKHGHGPDSVCYLD